WRIGQPPPSLGSLLAPLLAGGVFGGAFGIMERTTSTASSTVSADSWASHCARISGDMRAPTVSAMTVSRGDSRARMADRCAHCWSVGSTLGGAELCGPLVSSAPTGVAATIAVVLVAVLPSAKLSLVAAGGGVTLDAEATGAGTIGVELAAAVVGAAV